MTTLGTTAPVVGDLSKATTTTPEATVALPVSGTPLTRIQREITAQAVDAANNSKAAMIPEGTVQAVSSEASTVGAPTMAATATTSKTKILLLTRADRTPMAIPPKAGAETMGLPAGRSTMLPTPTRVALVTTVRSQNDTPGAPY